MRRIAVLALNGGYTSSLCNLLDIAHIANLYIGNVLGEAANNSSHSHANTDADRIVWKVISLDGLPAHGTEGAPMAVDLSVEAATEDFDVVFVPAFDYPDTETFFNRLRSFKPLYPWLVRQWERGAAIASICTGTFVLAEAGLLDRRLATTSWWLEKQFHRRYPAAKLDISRDITEDDRILCGSTLGVNLQLSLRLIELLSSPDIATMTARTVSSGRGVEPASGAEQHWPLYTEDDLVAKTQYWFQKNLSKKIKLSDVADSMLVSERTLIRHFKKTLGITPHVYLQNIRMDSAKNMLERTNLRIEKVAERVGYGDIAFFQQVFRGHAGVTPTVYRKSFAAGRAAAGGR
jgi:transcriptional regulator GlxA family with amidase domain